MLIQPDKNELGDKRLSPEESVAKERASLLDILNKRNIHGHDDLIQADRSQGSRLHYGELITRLRRLCPSLLVKDGIEGNVALYIRKSQNEMAASGYDLSMPQWYNENKYATGFPKGWIPEWGHLTTDTDNRAEHEIRGWRSVLIALIKTRAITYAAAVNEFGDPSGDQRAQYWMEQLLEFKNK
jgi:hypothetical protein